MPMIDLGKKPDSSGESIAGPMPSDPKVYYPNLYISDIQSDLEIDSDMMNKDITITAVVRITGFNKRTSQDKKGSNTQRSLDLEVRKIDFGKKAGTKDLQDAIEEGLEK